MCTFSGCDGLGLIGKELLPLSDSIGDYQQGIKS